MTPRQSAGSPFTRYCAARAALAAVRFALMIDPSMMTSGRPVSVEFRITTADARSG